MISVTGKRGRTQRGESAGFTLIELCITGVIIGLISSLCWPTLRNFTQSLTLKASAQEFAQRLRVSREKAVLTGLPQKVSAPNNRGESGPDSVAMFFPDGSANFFEFVFESKAGRKVSIQVNETGHVDIHD